MLDVQDQGQGFDPGAVTANGLLGMRERALRVGARLDVRSRPGHGTLVRLSLPLQSDRDAVADPHRARPSVVAFSIITVAHVVLGELAPKSAAIARTGPVALMLAPPMRAFYLAT